MNNVVELNQEALNIFNKMVSDKTRFRDSIEKFKKSMEESKYAYIGVEVSHLKTCKQSYCFFSNSLIDIRGVNVNKKMVTIVKNDGEGFCDYIVKTSDLPKIELSKTDVSKIESINVDKLKSMSEDDNIDLLALMGCFCLNKNQELSSFPNLENRFVMKKVEDKNVFVLISKSNKKLTPVAIMECDKNEWSTYSFINNVYFSSDASRSEFNEEAYRCIQCKEEYQSDDFVAYLKLEDSDLFS